MKDSNRFVAIGARNHVWTGCTVATGTGEFCDAPVPEGAPISACGQHLAAAFRYCEDLLDRARGHAARPAGSDEYVRLKSARERMENIQKNRVVYYMLIGRHIKIGTTAHIDIRMTELKADALLATEPGWYDLEQYRHAQFDHLRVIMPGRRTELFEVGDDLLEHIDRIAAAEDSVIV